jgi:hypothetical protein
MECVYYGYALKAIRELQEKNKNTVNSNTSGNVIISSVSRKQDNK